MIGTHLDKYEVLQKVGEGGMATVYRGRHATLDRDVAIKVLHPHLSSSTRNRRRFAREARAIEHLRHDNILEIFDYSGVDTPDCYIITEFVNGATLTELMERCRRLPSEVVTLIGLDLAGALAYAHRAGILHRDLKPDNVMLRRDGKLKLMDFGIARFLDESQVTMTGALVGSPAFMSPEQAKEEALDARSDLFSLGTLLFFLVTGHLPFAGANPSLILKRIIEGDRAPVAELAPGMSATLADVIERLMSVPAEERFPTAEATAEALAVALDEIGFDRDEPRWRLDRYLQEPDAYEADLQPWLVEHLLDAGRARMEAGESLDALRLLNRLLTLDETHEEALTLVQGFHGMDAEPPSTNRWIWPLLGGGMIAALLAAAVVGRLPAEPAEPEDPTTAGTVLTAADPVEARATVEPPSPTSVPPEPTTTAPLPQETPPPRDDDPVDPPASPDAPTDAPRPRPRRTPPPRDDAAPAPSPGDAEVTPPTPDGAPEPAADDADAAPACIALRSLGAPADVYLDDQRVATTRDSRCLELPPGTYTFVLRGAAIQSKAVTVELAPGARLVPYEVDLELKPAEVTIREPWSGRCRVLLDGVDVGTVASLDRTLEVPRPRDPHVVTLDCGEDGVHVAEYAAFDFPNVTFEPTRRSR